MSRRRRVIGTGVLLLGGLALIGPRAAAAQISDAELNRRLDELRPVLGEAWDASEAEKAANREARRLQAEQEMEEARVPLDTLQVGPLHVVTFADQAELARELFEEVREESFSNIDGSPSLARTLFAFQWRTPLRAFVLDGDDAHVVHPIRLNRVWTPTRADVKRRLGDQIATVLLDDIPREAPVRAWIAGRNARAWRGYPAPGQAYRGLVVTPSGATRACATGDEGACDAAFGLRFDDERVPEWLTLEEQQQLLAGASGPNGEGMDADDPLVRGCLEEDDGGACARALRELVAWTGAAPLGGATAMHLFWYAVRVGGPGAWERALESLDSTPTEALAHVSGLSVPELVSRWRETVMDNPPDVHAGLGTTRWATLFWFLVLAALAMRSTRWRLG